MSGVDCARYIGLVTRQVPSQVTREEARVYAISSCDSVPPVGSYVVVEPRDGADARKYLATVSEVRLEDVYAVAKTPVLTVEQELAVDLRYVPRLLALDLEAECDQASCRPPVTPVPIHSRVRLPQPGEVASMLGLPRSGVVLGELATASGETLSGEEVSLPLSALRHHVLVVGTTGSGKTTLLKGLARQLASDGKTTVVALDVIGHYHHLALDGVSTRVVYPVTGRALRRLTRRGGRSPRRAAAEAARRLVRRYLGDAFGEFGLAIRRVRARATIRENRRRRIARLARISVIAEVGNRKVEVEVIPWALETRQVLTRVDSMTGMLSQQARLFYGKVIERLRSETHTLEFRAMYELLTSPSDKADGRRRKAKYEEIADDLGIHPSTMENIVRSFLALSEMDLFDVRAGPVEVVEPDYSHVFRPGYVVVDLRRFMPHQQRLIVYRLLDRAYAYMAREHARDRGRTMTLLIDEAHVFFPQTRSEEEKALVESHLTRITRIGRGRGISVVFATHMPDDLNDVVLQLTNTKVVLRSDEKVLEKLGVPARDRRFLAVAETGLAWVKSYAFKRPVYVRIKANVTHLG